MLITILLLFDNNAYSQFNIGKIRLDTVYGKIKTISDGVAFNISERKDFHLTNGIDIGLIKNNSSRANGIVLSPIRNKLDRFYGISLSSINSLSANSYKSGGFLLSLISNKSYIKSFTGITLTGGVNRFGVNIYPGNHHGVFLAGWSNIFTAKRTNGIIISGFKNESSDMINGVSLSLYRNKLITSNGLLISAYNYTSNQIGCSIGLINTTLRNMQGLRMGLLNISEGYNSKGVSVGLISNYNFNSYKHRVRGNIANQFSGLFLSAGINIINELKGFNISGAATYVENFEGVTFSGVANIVDLEMKGIAMSPAVNLINEGKGILISGIANYVSEDFEGGSISLINIGDAYYQLGLLNFAKSAKLQIGLLNFNKSSKFKVLPIINFKKRAEEKVPNNE
ncbi:MAG: hypothetical protein MRY83_01620 [Flavobacteriales bacterium]|nr:hypothetical protein [Flavobacteriales bacterium]